MPPFNKFKNKMQPRPAFKRPGGFVPPGLAKKPGQMPPGQFKKVGIAPGGSVSPPKPFAAPSPSPATTPAVARPVAAPAAPINQAQKLDPAKAEQIRHEFASRRQGLQRPGFQPGAAQEITRGPRPALRGPALALTRGRGKKKGLRKHEQVGLSPFYRGVR